jgi:3-dehydroquinate dehydratase / shikimate dehydrogenase
MESKPPHLCVAICERSLEALQSAGTRASDAGDLVELRLDCLDEDDFNSGADRLKKLLHSLSVPAIVTYRPHEQGGSSHANFESRLAFWNDQGLSLGSHLCDIELDIAQKLSLDTKSGSGAQVDWSRLICSHHDFRGVPGDLAQIYEALRATPAGILKISVKANDATDCLPVFQILERALKEGRAMIAIAMGDAGFATRILGPSRGAFLTYAALENETGTAPGQISARELKQVYRVEKIDRQTQIFGLMGRPVGHSISPCMHNAAFDAMAIDAVYLPFEVQDVRGFIKRMIHPQTRELDWNLRGLSITAPHKSTVMHELDWIDPAAEAIGAVNTIVVMDGGLHGYNTDARGLINPLVQKFGELRGARCAVLGSGGAARAALWALSQEGAELTVFARDTAKAGVLAGKFDAALETLGEVGFDGFDVVINTTPLGTAGGSATQTPATAAQLRGARLAYDLVYNPTETLFLREAREAGCETLGGLSMLIAQAAEQFKLWTGLDGSEGVMCEAAEQALQLI